MPIETLRRFSVLCELSDGDLAALARVVVPVSLERGEYLFREGDEGDALFFLTSGTLVAERTIAPSAGTSKELAILPSLSVIGEMALADHQPRSASVRAEFKSTALRLGRTDFERLASTEPTLSASLYRALYVELSRRLRATSKEVVALYEVGRLVAAAAAEPRAVAVQIIDSLSVRIDASQILVGLYEPETNGLSICHAVGTSAAGLIGLKISLFEGLAARSFDEKKPLLVERLVGASEPWESQSMILAPLVHHDAAVGVLFAGVPRSGTSYRMHDLSLVTAVANISARVLEEGLRKRH